MLATKCVAQTYGNGADDTIEGLLARCLTLTYNAIHYGEENGVDNRRGMKEFYRSLKQELLLPSCYKVAVIARACAVIKSRKKSEKRGVTTMKKHLNKNKSLRPMVCLISGFFITMKGRLFISLARDRYFDVQLNRYVHNRLMGKTIRSLTITPKSISFCYSEEVEGKTVRKVWGVDRNEKNLTFGDKEMAVQVNLSKIVKINQTTREIIASFKRNDVRVRRRLSAKYWRRANHRGDQILHATANFIVGSAAKSRAALALEDLTDIRKMYRRGNRQGEDYRFRMNSWSFWRVYKMLDDKSAWKGVTFVKLTKADTYGSSSECTACGEKLHRPGKGDVKHARMLWCQQCKRWVDRDVNAVGTLSERGLARFASSHPLLLPPSSGGRSQQAACDVRDEGEEGREEKGLAGEARKGNPSKTTVILRVDASKLPTRSFVGEGLCIEQAILDQTKR